MRLSKSRPARTLDPLPRFSVRLGRERFGTGWSPIRSTWWERAGRFARAASLPGLLCRKQPECAVAECFGAFDVWDRDIVEAAPATPLVARSRFALASYLVPEGIPLRNLDSATTLVEEELAPSQVVSRDRSLTQTWATRFMRGEHTPVYRGGPTTNRRGTSVGVWQHDAVRLASAPRNSYCR